MVGALRPRLRGTAVVTVLRGITTREGQPLANGAVVHLPRHTVGAMVEVTAEDMAEVADTVLDQGIAQDRAMEVVVDTTAAHPNRTVAASLADTVPRSRRSFMRKSRRHRRRADLAVWVLL